MAGYIARKLAAWAAPGQMKTTVATFARNQLLQYGRLERTLVVNTAP